MEGPRNDLIERNNLLAQGESLRGEYQRMWMNEKVRANTAEAKLTALINAMDEIGMWVDERLSGRERQELSAMIVSVLTKYGR